VVGGDPDKDVAVLQLLDISPEKMRELKPVQLGISSTLMVGQRCASCIAPALTSQGRHMPLVVSRSAASGWAHWYGCETRCVDALFHTG
jgi:hypothetical protein